MDKLTVECFLRGVKLLAEIEAAKWHNETLKARGFSIASNLSFTSLATEAENCIQKLLQSKSRDEEDVCPCCVASPGNCRDSVTKRPLRRCPTPWLNTREVSDDEDDRT